jgi:hypothetical protein
VLKRRRLRWYVFGAQAANAYGRPRMTADVDVTIEVPAPRLAPLVTALGRAGFTPRVDDVAAFVARARVIPFLHRRTRIPVDVVLAGEGLEQTFLARARVLDLGGVRVPVLSPEDVIVTKLLAGRPTDLSDVESVLALQAEALDEAYVRRVLGELEAALGDVELLATLERLRPRGLG